MTDQEKIEAIVKSWEQAVMFSAEGWGHNETVSALTALVREARRDELSYVHIRDNYLYTTAPNDGSDHTVQDRMYTLKQLQNGGGE